jgi:predicted amidophosphoribosyltransferase
MNKFKETLVSLVFPARCLHCDEKVKSRELLCSFCSSQIEFVDDQEPFSLAAIEAQGPFMSLLHHTSGSISGLVAKAMSAFMVIAYERAGAPPIDFLIPSPRDFAFNQELAKSVSFFLEIPVFNALKPPRFFQNEESFRWNTSYSISDKHVLVIDTVLTSKDFLLSKLQEGFPMEAFFLSFCNRKTK